MSTEPETETEFLASLFEIEPDLDSLYRRAAAELRRLDALAETRGLALRNTELHLAQVERGFDKALLQRDALVEALNEVFALDEALLRDIFGSEFVKKAGAALTNITPQSAPPPKGT